MPSIRCANCGHRIILPAPTSFCPNCGSPYSQSPQPVASPPAQAGGGGGQQQMMGMVAIPQPQGGNAAPPNPIIISAHIPPGGIVDIPGMPKRPPELEGVVLNMQTHQMEESDFNEFFAFKMLRDIIWPVYEHNNHDRKRTTVTTVRVRSMGSEERDARMEGDITGGSVNMGDTLLFWGRFRRGTLRVRKAYNRTSEAQVTTRLQSTATAMSLVATMVVLVIVLIVIMLILQANHTSFVP